eukprot:4169873-Pyramimonas_sp.AAC.1
MLNFSAILPAAVCFDPAYWNTAYSSSTMPSAASSNTAAHAHPSSSAAGSRHRAGVHPMANLANPAVHPFRCRYVASAIGASFFLGGHRIGQGGGLEG